jgi:hypothetical protein
MDDTNVEYMFCEWCDAEFRRPSPIGPAPKYCKQSHRQRAYEERTFIRRSEVVVFTGEKMS